MIANRSAQPAPSDSPSTPRWLRLAIVLYSASMAPYLTRAGVDYFVLDISQGQLKRECAEVTALLSGRGALPEVFSGNYDGSLA